MLYSKLNSLKSYFTKDKLKAITLTVIAFIIKNTFYYFKKMKK